MEQEVGHLPVMLEEVILALSPHPGSVQIDATVGGGGHAVRILEATSPDGRLLGIDADPLQSREFSLLSAILQHAWKSGQSPDLAALIAAVQEPPFDKIGVLSLDEFFPARQRRGLSGPGHAARGRCARMTAGQGHAVVPRDA